MALVAPAFPIVTAAIFVAQLVAVERRGAHPVFASELPADVATVRDPVCLRFGDLALLATRIQRQRRVALAQEGAHRVGATSQFAHP